MVAGILGSVSPALAHRVILFAYVDGDRVFTEGYFSDGKRCQNARVEVFDRFGNKVVEGNTDRNGEFSFTPPKGKDLRIVLTASMGHRDEYTIPAGELQGEAEGKKHPESKSHEATEKEKGKPARRLTPREMNQIRTVVGEVLDEKLKPVMEVLSKRQNGRISFVQVIGGIGIIFGIMGIVLYFKSKRKMEGHKNGS
jgi:nickel transport protein